MATTTDTAQITIHEAAAETALHALTTQAQHLEQRIAREGFDAKHARHDNARNAARNRYYAAVAQHTALADAAEAIQTALLAK